MEHELNQLRRRLTWAAVLGFAILAGTFLGLALRGVR